jgi:dipeptidyl aminopeptidase/acylaminoacyl peptidase
VPGLNLPGKCSLRPTAAPTGSASTALARDREFLRVASPLTRIDQVTAPLFLIHGANDPRVPLSEAAQIHAALTDRGQECELLVYGDEGHGLAQRANRADAAPKALAFLARHLAG